MNTDRLFLAEYAKSGRSSCKTCKTIILKDNFRIGVMVQSPNFDRKIPMWHHSNCLLGKKTISSIEDIANFDNLRWEDQKQIKDSLGKKQTNGRKSKDGKKVQSEFLIEYAKSGRAICKECITKISKGEIRISKLITDTPEVARYGPMPGWHHIDCFIKIRVRLGFIDSAKELPGFKELSDEDQKMVSNKITKLSLKRKVEDEPAVPSKKLFDEDKLLKSQNDLLFNMRDHLKKNMSKEEMVAFLKHNNQYIPTGEQSIRDHLSDCLVFGNLKVCPECKNSRLRFKLDAYRCPGNLTEWTKCQYVTKCPEREAFIIPEDFRVKFDFLQDYKYVKRERLLLERDQSSSSTVNNGPLAGYVVSLIGKFKETQTALEQEVVNLSGAISEKITNTVNFIISTEAEVAKKSKNMLKARRLDIHVVSPKFLEDVKNNRLTPAAAIKEYCICSWGKDPILKFGIKQENKSKSQDLTSSFTSGKSSTVKISVKGGAAVDPDSGMEKKCHVYQEKDNIYNVVLGCVDIARGMNTYYKLQVLKSNRSAKYYVFRSWGRVGTTIGSNKLESFKNSAVAISEFERIYLDKTNNNWNNRKNFVKQPDFLYPLDIDYGEDLENLTGLKPGDNSKLPNSIQELICLIFDIEAMKKAMVEFEIDLKKMPLGKLSKKQIQHAYSVLNEAQQVLLTGSNATKILDASNRFYTLIPHDFGLKQPPLLDNEDLIKLKIEMLDSLLEIEFAYKMLKDHDSAKDPVDEHYEKLNTDIEVLDDNTDEFKIVKNYLQNTHAHTHDQYSLVLNKVFKINRHEESDRYNEFKDLHNKKLLWHGSRLTNYVGILSQGLRIAPPEAPVTGYMFGKGIYFADMVSKSANYCFTTKKNPTGLLMLCEVALGDMYEKEHAEYVNKLPANKHSTKGQGMTVPDPKDKTFIGDVEVPFGKPVKSDITHSSLLYNEYIVYDVKQVNIKYLLDVKFKYKR